MGKSMIFILLALLETSHARAQSRNYRDRAFPVEDLQILGAVRTDLNWLTDFLDLRLPRQMTLQDLADIEQKLLTTDVFSVVSVRFRRDDSSKFYILVIELKEKWTTIPVARGAFGGGTPLTVFGMYDTHSFGRLWTLGGEVRRYGNSPSGGVLYFRAPRWLGGHHEVGAELWRDFRRRYLYGDQDISYAHIDSDAKKIRLFYLAPFSYMGKGAWKKGLDLRIEEQAKQSVSGNQAPVSRTFRLIEKDRMKNYKMLGRLTFDDISINGLNHDGTRFMITTGPVAQEQALLWQAESELFYYHLYPRELNFAFHAFAGVGADHYTNNVYFLGGFDSVRGLPDGIMVGSKAAYVNTELRLVSYKSPNLIVQNAVFVDAGTAGYTGSQLLDESRASMGLGVRIAIPQIYRLVIRIDYAQSLDRTSTRGFSIGMNQFFQPYRPL